MFSERFVVNPLTGFGGRKRHCDRSPVRLIWSAGAAAIAERCPTRNVFASDQQEHR